MELDNPRREHNNSQTLSVLVEVQPCKAFCRTEKTPAKKSCTCLFFSCEARYVVQLIPSRNVDGSSSSLVRPTAQSGTNVYPICISRCRSISVWYLRKTSPRIRTSCPQARLPTNQREAPKRARQLEAPMPMCLLMIPRTHVLTNQ